MLVAGKCYTGVPHQQLRQKRTTRVETTPVRGGRVVEYDEYQGVPAGVGKEADWQVGEWASRRVAGVLVGSRVSERVGKYHR